ncbi:MAG: multidrug resistance efflux transporter family protein [Bacillota bacterium]
MKAIILGILASLFFALTFILNRAMELSGGSWIWSAVLRYVFMIPFLLLIVFLRGNLKDLFLDMKAKPFIWLKWSTVGFGLFYAPLCFAAAYGPSWLVASMWQVTIVAGSLLVPFFYQIVETPQGIRKVRQSIPIKGLIFSLVILAGIVIMQVEQLENLSTKQMVLGISPVVLAAFAYPLGNRKMMVFCGNNLDAYQRVLGMTLASIPFWLILSIYGYGTVGIPSFPQTIQTLLVAISSGVIATVLFFSATDISKNDVHKLAAVEATQSGEVVFSLVGEIFLLNGKLPSNLSFTGMVIVIGGMLLHSFSAKETNKEIKRNN